MADNRKVELQFSPVNAPESGTTWDIMFSRTAQTKDAAVNQGNILHSGLTFMDC